MTTILIGVALAVAGLVVLYLLYQDRGINKDDLLIAVYDTIIQIQSHPETYTFFTSLVGQPEDPKCLWGWIGHFLGMPAGSTNGDVAKACGYDDTVVLYFLPGSDDLDTPEGAVARLRYFAEQLEQELEYAF